jgi:hypothetical protein
MLRPRPQPPVQALPGANIRPRAHAPAATGTVFVTGGSGAAGTVPDYATVAYHG